MITTTDDHFLEQRFNEKPSATLKELLAKLELEIGLTVCLTTVGNAVNGMMYSYKKMHYEPATMNSLPNKGNFLRTLTEAIGNGKSIVWHDEINFNVWCTRSTGWSRVGRRAVVARWTSKGQNLHIIGAIEQTIGIVYYTIRQGSLKKEDFLQLLQELVNACEIKGIAYNELAVVIDNALAHCEAGEIVEANPGVQVIRLGPYSPALNGIEACWSVVKSAIKQQLSARQQELFEAPAETTQVAHRLRIMREIADETAMLNLIPC